MRAGELWRSAPGAVAAGILVASTLLACGGGAPAGVVARVDGADITSEELQTYLEANAGLDAKGLPAAVLSSMLDQLLDEELIYRVARDEGFVIASDDRRAAVDRLLEAHASEPVSEAEITAYYRAHADELRRPERVRLRQILVPERAQAETALRALAAGRDFAEVAREMSTDPTAPYGGEQGELAREDVPKLFVDTVFALAPGEHSGIVDADYGFHIFQVVERQAEEVLSRAAAAVEIRALLEKDSVDRKLAQLLAAARSKYTVEVYVENLPFDYRGTYRASSPQP